MISSCRVEFVSCDTHTEDVLARLSHAEDAVLVPGPDWMLTTKDVMHIINENLDLSAPIRDYMHPPVLTMPPFNQAKHAGRNCVMNAV
ncbi:MAG: hypothetical protein U1C96_11275 [Gallionella sp.]|nr:hypothetical protein [Gallionella sp.]